MRRAGGGKRRGRKSGGRRVEEEEWGMKRGEEEWGKSPLRMQVCKLGPWAWGGLKLVPSYGMRGEERESFEGVGNK